VDFDGTLCQNKWPAIGEANQEVIDYILRARKQRGAKLILWTNRTGFALEHAKVWCEARGIHFDAVNENLPEIIEEFGSDTRKVFATEYIDDRANVRFQLPYFANIQEELQ
jgi:hypothetical protein